MNQQQLETLCDILVLMFEYYKDEHYLRAWFDKCYRHDSKQVDFLIKKLTSVRASLNSTQDQQGVIEELVYLLNRKRYYTAVHSKNQLLRHVLQDALLEVLSINNEHIKQYKKMVLEEENVEGFLNYLSHDEDIESYKTYYAEKHSIYGRYMKNFSEKELWLAAKGGIVNGKLVDYFGIRKTIAHGLGFIRTELKLLQKNRIEKGFLTMESIAGYLEKLDFLLHPANEIQQDETALVQNARYLLEDIINAAGVEENAKARYKEHQAIIDGCYWVDEWFQLARGLLEAETLTS